VTTGLLGLLGLLILAAAVALVKLAADSRAANVDAGLVRGRLADCPASPNCVSSDAAPDDSHHVAPIADPDGAVWQRLIGTVAAMDGATLVASDDRYAYFTFTTKLLRFVDDVEFHYRPDRGEIAVRSASRVGHGDLGANRRRVEQIRSRLAAGS
jgi:uncharacterized protein (DUF1499 family)